MAIEKSIVEYGVYGKCARISNGKVDLLLTLDMGPRIIRYGFVDGKNELNEAFGKGSETPDGFWNMIGGHRVWSSPEGMPLSYTIDDRPVDYEWTDNGVRVISKVYELSRLQKEIIVSLDENSSKVKVTNKLYNRNPWTIEYALWALTVMRKGGKCILPQDDDETDLLPNRYLTLWPYTKMNDPRLTIGDKYIIFRQDPNATTNCKIGFPSKYAWGAYINEGVMFVKRYNHVQGGNYPDNGCSYETFTCDHMLEMESLSTLQQVAPDGVISHDECWELFDDVKFADTLEDAERIANQYIK